MAGTQWFRPFPKFFRIVRIFFETGFRLHRLTLEYGSKDVSKPPKSTPHSDIDGVHRDEKRNVDSANEAGEDSGNLGLAYDESAGHPEYSDDRPDRDDRSA